MISTKPWYYSKTIWASIVAIVAALGSYAGLPIDAASQSQLTDNLFALAGIIGSFIAIWGRLNAVEQISQ